MSDAENYALSNVQLPKIDEAIADSELITGSVLYLLAIFKALAYIFTFS